MALAPALPPPIPAQTDGEEIPVRTRPGGRRFEAEIDVSELDDRNRPTLTWTARTRSLSRSNMIFSSRRMCYVGRMLVVAIHLIDDEPVPIFGRVYACDYDGDGLYRVDLDLLPLPKHDRHVSEWIRARSAGR